jgi:hypothetical protein
MSMIFIDMPPTFKVGDTSWCWVSMMDNDTCYLKGHLARITWRNATTLIIERCVDLPDNSEEHFIRGAMTGFALARHLGLPLKYTTHEDSFWPLDSDSIIVNYAGAYLLEVRLPEGAAMENFGVIAIDEEAGSSVTDDDDKGIADLKARAQRKANGEPDTQADLLRLKDHALFFILEKPSDATTRRVLDAFGKEAAKKGIPVYAALRHQPFDNGLTNADLLGKNRQPKPHAKALFQMPLSAEMKENARKFLAMDVRADCIVSVAGYTIRSDDTIEVFDIDIETVSN